jgi:Dickkopf N-terminal cysteine-rich region
MRMRIGSGVLAAIAALSIAGPFGCGGDGNRPSISSNKDNVCGQVAAVACYNMYQCCAETEIEAFLKVTDPRTEDQCREDVQRRCERQISVADWSIDNNRARFDGDIMNACLKAILAPSDSCASIDAMLPWADACKAVAWVGTVATGSACYFTYECTGPDAYCSAGRVCTALPTENMPCSAMGCASNLFCNVGTCKALLAAGAPCVASNQCQKGLYCDGAAQPQPVCATLKANGEACTASAACQSNTCLPGTCAGTSQQCFSSAACAGHCENNPNIQCTQDPTCGAGICSEGGGACFVVGNCGPTAAGVCNFANKCIVGQCVGNPVCAPSEVAIDYCTGALGALPVGR